MFTGEIKRARSKRPLYIALGFVALIIVIVLLVPMPFTVKSTFELAPVTTVDVLAPRAGTLSEITVASGGMVAKGAVIAKYDIAAAEQKLPELSSRVDGLEVFFKMKRPHVDPPSAKVLGAIKKAEAALKAADLALTRARTAAKGKQTAPLAAAEKKQEAAAAALEKARAALPLSLEAREKQLAAAKAELEAVQAEIASANVFAPASGMLVLGGVEKGKPVTKDAKVAVVEDTSKLKAIVKVPVGEMISKGQAVELVLPQGKYRVIFDSDAKGDVAEAMFDNAKGELSSGLKGEANIEGTQRSIVSR